MTKRVEPRKDWTKYPPEYISYGQHKHGFGIYHINGLDYWIDEECAMPYEKKKYKAYLKSKGFTEPLETQKTNSLTDKGKVGE
jgi:hypothetical protein